MTQKRDPITRENGIYIFDPSISQDNQDYHAESLNILHKAENKYFWFLARKERILCMFNRYVPHDKKIIELGAGTGNISHYLMNDGYDVAVGEMHIKGLRYAQAYGIQKCYQFDLFDPPFENHFDAVGLFDVLEHLDQDLLALQQCRSLLKANGGKLILTVPAFNFLWSRDDAYGHKRRYTVKSLNRIVTNAGFNVLDCRYYFSAIMPLLFLRRIIHPDDGSPLAQEEYNSEIKINPLLNRLLKAVCRVENKIYSFIPNFPGGSIILIAEKEAESIDPLQ